MMEKCYKETKKKSSPVSKDLGSQGKHDKEEISNQKSFPSDSQSLSEA